MYFKTIYVQVENASLERSETFQDNFIEFDINEVIIQVRPLTVKTLIYLSIIQLIKYFFRKIIIKKMNLAIL